MLTRMAVCWGFSKWIGVWMMIWLKYRLAICYTLLWKINIKVVGISLGHFPKLCQITRTPVLGAVFLRKNTQTWDINQRFYFRRNRTSMGFKQEKCGYQTNNARIHWDVSPTICSVCCVGCWGLLRNILYTCIWRCCFCGFGICSNFQMGKMGMLLPLHIF